MRLHTHMHAHITCGHSNSTLLILLICLGLKMYTDNTENRSSSHGNERLPPVYDEILPEKELAIELHNNEAYGHISH